MKICGKPGCSTLIESGAYCPEHESKRSHGWQTSTRRKPRGWDKLRRRVLRRDKYKCVICGGHAGICDHLLPMAFGGRPTDPSNLRAMCGPCHKRKTADERRLGKLLKRLSAESRKRELESFLARWER